MYKVVQTFLFWIWKFLIHLESMSVIGKSDWEFIRKQNPVLLSNLSSIFCNIKFGLLRKYLCPTFLVSLAPLLPFLTLNTTNCLIDFNVLYEATKAMGEKFKRMQQKHLKSPSEIEFSRWMHKKRYSNSTDYVFKEKWLKDSHFPFPCIIIKLLPLLQFAHHVLNRPHLWWRQATSSAKNIFRKN